MTDETKSREENPAPKDRFDSIWGIVIGLIVLVLLWALTNPDRIVP